LPDSQEIRRILAQRMGAKGSDAYHLLSQIGRDCVGALQFLPPNELHLFEKAPAIEGTPLDELEIERLLKNLATTPLGVQKEGDFRISVAGAQEKTALLWMNHQWMRPHGTTPTTHIFKTQIGHLPNGIDLSHSIENEYYCLKLLELFGLKTNQVDIKIFGQTKALVIERFDRLWTKDHRLLRLPQEDLCQALSVPPTLKYQNEGGPGMEQILQLLASSDAPTQDQATFLKAQILFWLIGAPDGHAKNFSIFLKPEGRFHLTPLYDVMTAQPSLAKNQLDKKQLKMAMCVGLSRHYRFDEITGRHFVETALKGGMPLQLIQETICNILENAETVFEKIENALPAYFPQDIHAEVKAGVQKRLRRLESAVK